MRLMSRSILISVHLIKRQLARQHLNKCESVVNCFADQLRGPESPWIPDDGREGKLCDVDLKKIVWLTR